MVLAAAVIPLTITMPAHAAAPGSSAPATPGPLICGSPVLNSPWYYDGGASTFTSGEYPGLPTFGSAGTDFPAATAGMIIPAGDNTAAGHAGTYNVNNTVVYVEPGQHIWAGAYVGHNSYWIGGYTPALGRAIINGVDGGTGGTGVGGAGFGISTPSSGSNIYVTYEYLTMENMAASENGAIVGDVNGASLGNGNTYKYDTIGPNLYGPGGSGAPTYGQSSGGGYAIDGESDTTIEYNCLIDNAQGAFNISQGFNVTIANNEIAGNGLGEYPDDGGPGASPFACGCSGGGKLFFTVNADVVNNYIHDNYNTGVWFDFDNTGADISHNYIASNWGSAVGYEASYNAAITNNTMTGNGWASNGAWPAGTGGLDCYGGVSCTNGLGPVTGAGGDNQFGAIGLDEASGNANMGPVIIPAGYIVPGCSSDCTITSRYRGSFTISGNVLTNNFGGVTLAQDTDRYPGNFDNDSTCSQPLGAMGQANSSIYYQQNKVMETANDVTISGSSVTSTAGVYAYCSNFGDTPPYDFGGPSQTYMAPQVGMGVWNVDTGAYLGDVATATSSTAFTLNTSPGDTTGARLAVGSYGGCGPSDYYNSAHGVTSGTPAELYWDNCIWGTQNVTVKNNSFNMDGSAVTGCTLDNLCGFQTVIVFNAGVPVLLQYFDAYINLAANAVGGLNNVWSDNAYTWTGGGPGSWQFSAEHQGNTITQAQWLSAPYNQDAGSTFSP